MTSPTDPAGWWSTIDNQLASKETRTARRSIAVNYPNDLYAFVLEAARLRNISMTGYQRRASLAFAQADLGFDWVKELAIEPPMGSFQNPNVSAAMLGRGYGSWQILRLGSFDE